MSENNQTTLYVLSADKRTIAHQSHTKGSERRPNQCKYWNLRPVVIPECSFIATRNSHAKHNQSVGRIPERGKTRLLNFSGSTSGNKKSKSVCWRGTYELFRWKQSMNSKSHANEHKLVLFLIPERRQTRLLNFSAAQVEIKREKECLEEALTYYFDVNNPWIPSHMPTNTS